MAKRTNKLTIPKFTLEFKNGIAYIIEHKKEEDATHILEDLMQDFIGKDNLSLSIGTDKEI